MSIILISLDFYCCTNASCLRGIANLRDLLHSKYKENLISILLFETCRSDGHVEADIRGVR